MLAVDPAFLAAQLLNDDEDSEALLAKLQPRSASVVRQSSTRQPFGFPSFPSGANDKLSSSTRQVVDPVVQQHRKQQDRIAPMRSRVATVSTGVSVKPLPALSGG